MNTIIPVTILLTAIQSVASVNYHHIGDCHYIDSFQSFDGKFNLTFICVETQTENTFFNKDPTSKCRRNNFAFYKSAIGVINFKDCELHEIELNMFDVYSKVHSFNISHLGLQSLHPNLFKSAKNLTKINASHNFIKNISVNIFPADDNHVELLDLSYNNITELNVQLFRKLPELKHLSVSRNRIGELPSFLFHNSKHLVDIDLSFNFIRRIDDLAFFGDINLEKLNLSHNQLTVFNKKVLENHDRMTHFDFSHNQISEIKADTFQGLRNLVHLNLAHNPIKVVNNETFLTLVKLEHLNLSQTLLKEIAPGTFLHQINLQVLDLSFNEIAALHLDTFPNKIEVLQSILFEGNNQLHTLSGFTSRIFSKIHGVDSMKFKCTFLSGQFQPNTWADLDNILAKINCRLSDDDLEKAIGVTEISNRLNANKNETTENTTEVIKTKFKNTISYNELKQSKQSSNICSSTETSIHIFVTTCINSVCLIIAVISLIYFVFHRRRMQKMSGDHHIFYRPQEIETLNIISNNECETILRN